MNSKVLALYSIVGLIAFWSIGVLADLWAQPTFSAYWILPHDTANNFAYIGLFLSTVALIINNQRQNKKQATTQIETLPPYILKQEKPLNEAPTSKPYVTINGKEPPEPTSIFNTKTFQIVGTLFAILIGLIVYFYILT